MRFAIVLGLVVLACGARGARAEEEPANRVQWRAWSEATFREVERERKALLLVVSTTWCHWCHVMQRETYADPRVEQALARGFVAVKVDADDRPDLAERFRKYRWPATAFFGPDGEEVLALRGYRSADELLAILADVERRVKAGGPFPGFDSPTAPRAPQVDPDRTFLEGLRARLVAQLDGTYDAKEQGWGAPQKYPLPEPVLWGLRRGLTHPQDKQALRRAMDTLAASEALLDPGFGGMFQYSVGPAWKDPHYEKIMGVNAGALETYARAYEMSGNPRWKRDAEQVKRWFERFLSAPDGAFYTSQDAEVNGREATAYHRLDEAGRLAVGVPRVDTSVYARENGQAIQAYLAYARALNDADALVRAERAAARVVTTHREASSRLLRHRAAGGVGSFFLLDQAEMGLALLALDQARADGAWRATIEDLALALGGAFGTSEGGWADVSRGSAMEATLVGPAPSLEGHARAALFLLRAAAYLDRPELRREALRGIAAMSDPAWLADHWRAVGVLLLTVEEALAPTRVVTLHGMLAGEASHKTFLGVVRSAQRRDPALAVRWAAPTPGASGPARAPFATVCAPDGTCSEPLESPFVLETALASR